MKVRKIEIKKIATANIIIRYLIFDLEHLNISKYVSIGLSSIKKLPVIVHGIYKINYNLYGILILHTNFNFDSCCQWFVLLTLMCNNDLGRYEMYNISFVIAFNDVGLFNYIRIYPLIWALSLALMLLFQYEWFQQPTNRLNSVNNK